jgi:hypothetical protein
MTDIEKLAEKVEENTKAVNELIGLINDSNIRTRNLLSKILNKQGKESRGHFWREVSANLTGDAITLLFLEDFLKGKNT